MSANLFQQYLQPPRSALDYANDFARADLEREQLAGARQTNALNAMTIREKQDAQARDAETRNALQRIAATWKADTKPQERVASLRNTGNPSLIAEADKLEKAELEAAKTRSEVGKRDGETLDATMARYRGALDFIDTREGAARWLQAQYSDPVLGQYMQRLAPLDQAIQSLPTDPNAFQQWRQQAGMGMQKFIEQQTQRRGQDITVRGQDMLDKRTREEGALNRGVQVRGQNLVNDRALGQQRLAEGTATAEAGGPGQSELTRQFGKAAPGYRWKADGSQEAIPGGPADRKNTDAGIREARQREASVAQADRVIAKVDQALAGVGITTAGAGSLLKSIPGTPARNLDSTLQTIKANLGFAELQAMRDASPTGGALGAIAVQELMALQSTVASLDQEQSPPQLRKSLNDIKTHYTNWKNAVSGNASQPSAPSTPSASAPGAPAQPYRDAEKERRYQEWKREQGGKL